MHPGAILLLCWHVWMAKQKKDPSTVFCWLQLMLAAGSPGCPGAVPSRPWLPGVNHEPIAEKGCDTEGKFILIRYLFSRVFLPTPGSARGRRATHVDRFRFRCETVPAKRPIGPEHRALRLMIGVALVLRAGSGPGWSQEEGERPPSRLLRQDEDWSKFGEQAEDGPFRDRIKFVSFGPKKRRWASFGGSARFRTEAWNSFGLADRSDRDDRFSVSRLLLHADVHWNARARLFVEAKSALASGRELPGGTRAVDADELDFQQAFVDFGLSPRARIRSTLRVGRQAFLFGRQRLVSPLPWGNALRS